LRAGHLSSGRRARGPIRDRRPRPQCYARSKFLEMVFTRRSRAARPSLAPTTRSPGLRQPARRPPPRRYARRRSEWTGRPRAGTRRPQTEPHTDSMLAIPPLFSAPVPSTSIALPQVAATVTAPACAVPVTASGAAHHNAAAPERTSMTRCRLIDPPTMYRPGRAQPRRGSAIAWTDTLFRQERPDQWRNRPTSEHSIPTS